MSRIDQRRVARIEQYAAAMLHIALVAFELRDDDAATIVDGYRFRRPFPKREGTRRKSRQRQATDISNLNRAMKGRLRKLNATVAANLLSIPLPSVNPI